MAGLLTIGEMAQACGLSARSLRHLEAVGLLAPRRTEAGRRVYATAEITQIMRVTILRQAGFSLREISELKTSHTLNPKALCDLQITLLEAKQARISRMISLLRETRALNPSDNVLDIDGFCHLIRQGQETMTNKAMKPVIDQYFTVEEQETWQRAGQALFPEGNATAYQIKWRTLIDRIEAAIAQDCSPGSAEGQKLYDEWLAMLRPLEDAMGPDMLAKTGRMYAEMDEWQTEDRRAPFSAAVFTFVRQAAGFRQPASVNQGASLRS